MVILAFVLFDIAAILLNLLQYIHIANISFISSLFLVSIKLYNWLVQEIRSDLLTTLQWNINLTFKSFENFHA